MSKSKNALRQHFIAPWKKGDTTAPSTDEAFLPLAKWIATVVSDIVAGDGDATEWEAFKATVTYIKNPTITKSTPPAA